MKYLMLSIIFSVLIFNGRNLYGKPTTSTENRIEKTAVKENLNDKEEIQNLIRQVLIWSDTIKNIDFLPVVADSNEKYYVGFDLKKLDANLEILKKTNLFANKFIENYKQIVDTLDKKLRNKEFGNWFVGEMPPFSFFSDVNPWCLCQDVPYDKPNPWKLVEIEKINLKTDSGEFYWKWGNLKPDYDPSWKEFRYKFRVVKENGKWKIYYLQGFDFEKCIK